MKGVNLGTLFSEKITTPLVAAIKAPPGNMGHVRLFWLGQAGFAIRYRDTLIIVDPYLSDYLAEKYQNAEFKHRRMMPPPILPKEAAVADWVIATHKHSDHLDPWTVSAMVAANPNLKIIVPESAAGHAMDMGVPQDKSYLIDAGQSVTIDRDIHIDALPSAHETLTTDADGKHLYLGYVMRFGALSVYHSGDCVPYRGLASTLAAQNIDLALLPINGRDGYRRERNIPGNFTVQEALNLCEQAAIPNMIGHHFGMFDFNTIDPKEAQDVIQQNAHIDSGCCAELDVAYKLIEKEQNYDGSV
ncbi:MAG: MBL fold metallo-hydrolase [Desulfobacterales bacterium]|jgi:L-ascorbate metabolism protein UlaG (beta-lactamase superfamily)